MASVISRATWTDDDGSGTTGTIINNARLQADVYDKVDAMFAGSGAYATFTFGGAVQVDGQTLNVRHATNPYIQLSKTNATAQQWYLEYTGGILRIRDATAAKNVVQLEDAAPTNSIFVKSTGHIGFGTSTPDLSGAYGATRTVVSVIGSSSYGVIETGTPAADGSGVGVGDFAFIMPANTGGAAEKRVAIISATTSGTTANQRGGQLIFYTKSDGAGSFFTTYIDHLGHWGFNIASSASYKYYFYNPESGRWSGYFTNVAAAGGSYGLLIDAGGNSSDQSFQVRDRTGGTVYILTRGDGRTQINALVVGTSIAESTLTFAVKSTGVGDGLIFRESYAGNSALWSVVQNNGDGTGATMYLSDGAGADKIKLSSDPAGTTNTYFNVPGPYVFGATAGNRGDGTTPLTGTALTIVHSTASWLELSTTVADASNTLVGGINFNFQSSTDGYEQVAYIEGRTAADLGGTANKRGGTVNIWVRPDNSTTLTKFISVYWDYTTITHGVLLGAPTGGDKGDGTLNAAGDIYKNGTAFTNPAFVFEKIYTGKIERFTDRAKAIGLSHYQPNVNLEDIEFFVKTHYDLPLMAELPDAGLFDRGDLLLATIEEAYWHLFRLHDRVKDLESRLTA